MICDGNRVYFGDRGCEGERELVSLSGRVEAEGIMV